MSYHNETCGCAECGNYGQVYNPRAIHNQSCGCAECGNYPQTNRVSSDGTPSELHTVMVAVPVALLDEVRALIAQSSKGQVGYRRRVYILARELGIETEIVLAAAERLGLNVLNQLSSLTDDDCTAIKQELARK